MNIKTRRKLTELQEIFVRLMSTAEDVGEQIQELAGEEQEKFDSMPESLQGGDRGQEIEAAAGYLNDAAQACEAGDIGEAIDRLGQML